MASLKHRVEELERQQSPRPSHSALFDDDALMIYSGMAYLDATVEPTYHDVEPTEVYCRGKEVRDTLYGPIVPAHLDEHIRRYTRASGEFELTFGREPRTGDMLRYEHLALMHSPEIYGRHFGRLADAWRLQLANLKCPLKFEDGRLFRRLAPGRQGEEPKWEEDVKIQPQDRWLRIPEVAASADFDPDTRIVHTIAAVVFLGVNGTKHQCRPADAEEMVYVDIEPPIEVPAFFKYASQRFCDLLVNVFGA